MDEQAYRIIRSLVNRVIRSNLHKPSGELEDMIFSVTQDCYLYMASKCPEGQSLFSWVRDNGGLVIVYARRVCYDAYRGEQYTRNSGAERPKAFRRETGTLCPLPPLPPRREAYHDPEPEWIEEEHREFLVSKLRGLEKEYVQEIVATGKSVRQLAESRGVSHQRVYSVLNNAKRRIQSNDY